ncbi:oxidoreductase [Paraburkholderia acidicola]|uniref:Oxidoreductase n=1 Tax=Paraburkholderia acidicola TaxID=1912599 RepID=A0A2A4ES80_9BURK|nr:SDR family oxidoreductase [Paraburkholderia acidicola]PCE23695.1 oxidoreductase [Paraburkholderia acidicola]
MSDLLGKVALVTGGSRGIGAAIAKRLAADGADVAISYASSPAKAATVVAEIESLGRRAFSVRADQGHRGQVAGLIRQVHEYFGKLDILVNSAAVFITGPVDDANADLASFDRQQAINIDGVVTAVRTAVPLLSDGGRIISIGSTVAESTPFPGFGDYAATKAAVAAYTRAWARDLGARRITVNVVQPGPINTDANPETSDFAPVVAKMTALGRYGQPEEIAAAVAFLAGPDANYVSGATLNVDGGLA